MEQHVTSSQQRSHFFRQVNGLSQTTQILDGKFFLLTRSLFDSFFPLPPLLPYNVCDDTKLRRHFLICKILFADGVMKVAAAAWEYFFG